MSTLNWLTELRKKMEIWKKYNRWLFDLNNHPRRLTLMAFSFRKTSKKKWISISSQPERCWYLAGGVVRRKAKARFARLYEENLIKCASKQFFSLVESLCNANATVKNKKQKNEFQLSHNHWQTIEKLQLTPTNECWNAHFIPPLSTRRWKQECENHDRSTRPNHGGVKYTAAKEREEWKLLHAWLFSNFYSSMLHVCHVMWNQDRKPIRKGQRSMRMLPSDSLEQWIKFPIHLKRREMQIRTSAMQFATN